MRDIRVLVKHPEQEPAEVNVACNLKSLQEIVGGYIETVTFAEDFVVICNEEGRMLGLPNNCDMCGVNFVGTIILCGIDGDDFGDIPLPYADIKRIMPNLWEV